MFRWWHAHTVTQKGYVSRKMDGYHDIHEMLTFLRMSWYPSIFMLTLFCVTVGARHDMNMHITLLKNAVSRELAYYSMHRLGAYRDINAPTMWSKSARNYRSVRNNLTRFLDEALRTVGQSSRGGRTSEDFMRVQGGHRSSGKYRLVQDTFKYLEEFMGCYGRLWNRIELSRNWGNL